MRALSILCCVLFSFSLKAMDPDDGMLRLIPVGSLREVLPGGQVDIDTDSLDEEGYRIPVEAPQDLKDMLANLEINISRIAKGKNVKKEAMAQKADIIGRICSIFGWCLEGEKMGIRSTMEFLNISSRDSQHPEKGASRSPYFDLVVGLQNCVDRYFSILFKSSRDNFGKLEPKPSQQEPGDALFWFKRDGHFFVVPEERNAVQKILLTPVRHFLPIHRSFQHDGHGLFV